MRSRLFICAVVALTATLVGSCENPGEPEGGECDAVALVAITVNTAGAVPVFDWSPRCPMSMVAVYGDADDMWGIATTNVNGTSSTAANIIQAPLTYGQAPAGTEEDPPEVTLVAGTTYTVDVWRVVPTTTTCLNRFGNLCFVGTREFVR